jgi:hypothetical protein
MRKEEREKEDENGVSAAHFWAGVINNFQGA